MSPIVTQRNRYPQLGRVSVGFQDSKPSQKKNGELSVFPRRSKTLCFHSDVRSRLELLQEDAGVGGTIRQSPTSTPDFEKWTLVSEATSIAVHLPPTNDVEKVASQYLESFTAVGLNRRCDGVDCILHRLPNKVDAKGKLVEVGELCHDIVPCICDAEGTADDARCKPTIRIAVLLADFWRDMQGLGVWLVTSTGWASNSALAGELELYRSILPQLGGAARFRLGVRMVSSRHGEVPELHIDLEHTPREAAALASGAVIDAPALGEGALELPVGTFVRPSSEEAPSGVDESDGGPPPATEPTSSAPDSLTIKGVGIPYEGGTTANEDGSNAIQPAQLTVLGRMGADLGWEPKELHFAFRHFAGHPIEETSIQTAQAFAELLKARRKERVSA